MTSNLNFSGRFVTRMLNYFFQNSHDSHPRLHIVWDEMLYLVLNSKKSDFKKFWMTVVDGTVKVAEPFDTF